MNFNDFFKGMLREQKERQSVPSDQCEGSGKMSKEQCYNLVTFGVMLPVIGYLCCVMQDFNLFNLNHISFHYYYYFDDQWPVDNPLW